MSWTSLDCTGLGCTGFSCRGLGYTALGCTALSCTTLGCTGLGWTGLGWTGFSWTGISWNGFSISWTGFNWADFSWTDFSWTLDWIWVASSGKFWLGTTFLFNWPKVPWAMIPSVISILKSFFRSKCLQQIVVVLAIDSGNLQASNQACLLTGCSGIW